MDPIDAMTNRNIRNVRVKLSLNREMFNKFESRKICVAGYQCDNSDFDFRIAEHNELPVIKICSDEGRDDYQQSKPIHKCPALATRSLLSFFILSSTLV